MTALPTMGMIPGFSAELDSIERALTWGGDRAGRLQQDGVPIYSGCVDSGNSPTTYLRPGLLLGKASSGAAAGQLTAYAAANTDGSQQVFGILLRGLSMLGWQGTAEQKYGNILVSGPVKASQLVGLDAFARRQMSGRFWFDDDIQDEYGVFSDFPTIETPVTANYQMLATDNGSFFTNTGAAAAVTLTLPALTPGFTVEVMVTANQDLAIASKEGANIVWDGTLAANQLEFETASHIIGGHLQFICNAAGTHWYVRNLGPATCTVTAS